MLNKLIGRFFYYVLGLHQDQRLTVATTNRIEDHAVLHLLISTITDNGNEADHHIISVKCLIEIILDIASHRRDGVGRLIKIKIPDTENIENAVVLHIRGRGTNLLCEKYVGLIADHRQITEAVQKFQEDHCLIIKYPHILLVLGRCMRYVM